jgi:hypothetical protein
MIRVRYPVTVALVGALVVACGSSSESKTYPTTFTCIAGSSPSCPANQTCPTVPLGTGCDDLPGLFDHPSIKVEIGRPEGCRVGLPYGNPYYGDSQQECICQKVLKTDPKPIWSCPV